MKVFLIVIGLCLVSTVLWVWAVFRAARRMKNQADRMIAETVRKLKEEENAANETPAHNG